MEKEEANKKCLAPILNQVPEGVLKRKYKVLLQYIILGHIQKSIPPRKGLYIYQYLEVQKNKVQIIILSKEMFGVYNIFMKPDVRLKQCTVFIIFS